MGDYLLLAGAVGICHDQRGFIGRWVAADESKPLAVRRESRCRVNIADESPRGSSQNRDVTKHDFGRLFADKINPIAVRRESQTRNTVAVSRYDLFIATGSNMLQP